MIRIPIWLLVIMGLGDLIAIALVIWLYIIGAWRQGG